MVTYKSVLTPFLEVLLRPMHYSLTAFHYYIFSYNF
jgi:hypothetical protein